MRNLKKVLALTLALALALTMFAGAFTAPAIPDDFDTLSTAYAKEAFVILNALGIAQGTGVGVEGAANLTRAQLAKMIYVAKTGDSDGGKNNTTTYFSSDTLSKTFKDAGLDSHWGKDFLNWAYVNGIMVGYPDGTIRPDQAVTGVEAFKMILVALGYNPKTEGLEGTTFFTNTMALAGKAGITKNVYVGDMKTPINRENTFIAIKNALYAATVQYVGNTATPKTETLGSTNVNDIITLGEEGFGLMDVTAVLVANEKVGLGAYWRNALQQANPAWNNWEINNIANRIGVLYYTYDKALAGYARFVYKDYSAAANTSGSYAPNLLNVKVTEIQNIDVYNDLGREFRLLITNKTRDYSGNENRVIYGVPVDADIFTSVGMAAENYKELNSTIAKTDLKPIIKAMLARAQQVNAAYNTTYTTYDRTQDTIDNTIFINGKPVTYREAFIAAQYKTNAPFRAVDNDGDGVYDHLFMTKVTLGYIDYVNDTHYGITANGAAKIADSIVTDSATLAKGDYVWFWNNAINGKIYIKKLNTFTSNISGYEGEAAGFTGKYTINGAKYVKSYSQLNFNMSSTDAAYVAWASNADDGALTYTKAGASADWVIGGHNPWGNLLIRSDSDIMGYGVNAITTTKFQFVMDEDGDNKFIDKVMIVDATKYEKYAVVSAIDSYTSLAGISITAPNVRLYTEDNEYLTAAIASVDGYPISNYYNNRYEDLYFRIIVDKLVSYVVDGNKVHLYTQDRYMQDINGINDATRTASGDLNTVYKPDGIGTYDLLTKTWAFEFLTSYKNNNTTIPAKTKMAFTGANGVVFVSYGEGGYPGGDIEEGYGDGISVGRLRNVLSYRYGEISSGMDRRWRAYWRDEYNPSTTLNTLANNGAYIDSDEIYRDASGVVISKNRGNVVFANNMWSTYANDTSGKQYLQYIGMDQVVFSTNSTGLNYIKAAAVKFAPAYSAPSGYSLDSSDTSIYQYASLNRHNQNIRFAGTVSLQNDDVVEDIALNSRFRIPSLPGIAARTNQVVGTIMRRDSAMLVDGVYTYTYSILKPNAQSASDYVQYTVSSNAAVQQLKVGSVYLLTIDENNNITKADDMIVNNFDTAPQPGRVFNTDLHIANNIKRFVVDPALLGQYGNVNYGSLDRVLYGSEIFSFIDVRKNVSSNALTSYDEGISYRAPAYTGAAPTAAPMDSGNNAADGNWDVVQHGDVFYTDGRNSRVDRTVEGLIPLLVNGGYASTKLTYSSCLNLDASTGNAIDKAFVSTAGYDLSSDTFVNGGFYKWLYVTSTGKVVPYLSEAHYLAHTASLEITVTTSMTYDAAFGTTNATKSFINPFFTDNMYYVLSGDRKALILTANTNVYYVKNLGSSSVEVYNYLLSNDNYIMDLVLSGKYIQVYVEYNEAYSEIINMWVDLTAVESMCLIAGDVVDGFGGAY